MQNVRKKSHNTLQIPKLQNTTAISVAQQWSISHRLVRLCMGEQSLQSINEEPKHPLAKPTLASVTPPSSPVQPTLIPSNTTTTTTRGRQSARGVACWLVCQKSQKKGPRTRVAEKGRRVRGMFWSPEPVLCSLTLIQENESKQCWYVYDEGDPNTNNACFCTTHNSKTQSRWKYIFVWEFVLNISNLQNTLVTLCHLPYG